MMDLFWEALRKQHKATANKPYQPSFTTKHLKKNNHLPQFKMKDNDVPQTMK